MKARLSFVPLLDAAGGPGEAAGKLDLSPERVSYYIARGLTITQAEDLADRLGEHPLALWPEMVGEFVDVDGVRLDVPADWVTVVQACRLTGVSFRQFDYWNRQSGFRVAQEAKGSGSRRYLSRSDVERLAVLARLSEAGLGDRQGMARLVGIVDRVWSDPPPSEIEVDLAGGLLVCVPVRRFAELAR